MKKDYRPTVDDFTPRNSQQLSCKAGGQFDKKFHLATKDGKVTSRLLTTRWSSVCMARRAQ